MKESTALVIRNYQTSDLRACRSLWVELTNWHRKIYGTRSIGGKDPGRHFDKHLRKVGSRNLWVAIRRGKVVGLAGLIRTERDGEVEPLVVTRNRRNTGVGRILMKKVESVARHDKLRELTVRPVTRNRPAIDFFYNLGFDTLGHLEMIMDLRKDSKVWKQGPKFFQKRFRF